MRKRVEEGGGSAMSKAKKRGCRERARGKRRFGVCAASGAAAFLFAKGVVKVSVTALCVTAIVCAHACAVVAENTEETREFFLSQTEITLFVGENATILLNVRPATKEKIAAEWFSHDESVVKAEGGKLTVIAEGETFVGVKTAENTLFCRVEVLKNGAK